MTATVKNVRRGPASAESNVDVATAPAAAGIKTVTDSTGRKYTLRKMKPSERFAISEVIEAATMSAGMQLITAATVVGIDDEGMTPIRTRAELLARLDEIGDEGLSVVTPVVMEMYGASLSEKDIAGAKK